MTAEQVPSGSRVAFVTGAGRGIGRAIAQRLARDGAIVAVADLVPDAAGEAASQIRREGGSARPVEVDVADEASVHEAIQELVLTDGRLDVLVNNAGIYPGESPLASTTMENWDRVLAVNLTGAFLCAKAAVSHLATYGHGRIVNIASRAWLGTAGVPAYCASKGGLISLTRSLALELGPRGITVNAVSPTSVETPLFAGMDERERDGVLARVAQQPIPRLGHPDEVAAAVAFLASIEAAYVTGQHLYVGGGAELRSSNLV